MAPDINSLPVSSSPRPLDPVSSQSPTMSVSSRRTSQIMGPPSAPASANLLSPSHRSSMSAVSTDQSSIPLRHPRPLTAAELYLECEKEQEAVVNRLTRELTALRAQSASVASNASHSSVSTSASLLPVDIGDPNPAHQLTGATHPTPSRRHRSSSSLSARSNSQPHASAGGAAHGQSGNLSNLTVGGVSQASADRAAAVVRTSRQPSATRSGASTPARQSMDFSRQTPFPGTLYTLPHRPSLSRDPSYVSQGGGSVTAQAGTPHQNLQPLPSPAPSPGHSMSSALQNHADAVSYRNEMEIVKAENEALRQRVRTLERALRTRRRDSSQSDAARPDLGPRPTDRSSLDMARSPLPSPAGVAAWAAGDGGVRGVAGPRERSESQSTSASSRRAVGVMDEELRVGESAGNAGMRGRE